MVTITGRKIHIAVVGCGRISRNHFGAIQKHEDAMELVAVCDTDETVLRETATQYAVPGYGSLDAMLHEVDCDVVSLCTPSGLHPAQAIRCAGAGRHVITEKPMATRWKDGLAMVKACDDAKVRLFVVKQNRCNATLENFNGAPQRILDKTARILRFSQMAGNVGNGRRRFYEPVQPLCGFVGVAYRADSRCTGHDCNNRQGYRS